MGGTAPGKVVSQPDSRAVGPAVPSGSTWSLTRMVSNSTSSVVYVRSVVYVLVMYTSNDKYVPVWY